MIDPQLLEDCHRLGAFEHCTLLLHRNAGVPWFILVPDTPVEDFLDLPGEQRNRVLAECAGVSRFIKQSLGYDKVNVAGLGNVVAQMHLHVIGRSRTDPCWPAPIWGRLPDGPSYDPDQITAWQGILTEDYGLVPEAL